MNNFKYIYQIIMIIKIMIPDVGGRKGGGG